MLLAHYSVYIETVGKVSSLAVYGCKQNQIKHEPVLLFSFE